MANNTYQAVIDAINALITDANLQSFTEGVIDRLASFGYTPVQSDAYMIAFVMQKSQHHIQNQINSSDIPDGLREIFIDMTVGEFLNFKYQSGLLNLSGLDFSGIVQSVNEGDTTVTFGSEGSDESKFIGMVNWLMTGREGDLVCYRRIRW